MTIRVETFACAQTFYIDPSVVNNARQVMISSVDLFFKHKPAIGRNYSGATYPGVSVFICETIYGVPRITRQSTVFTIEGSARREYLDIQTSSDASVATNFRLVQPFLVDTDKEYAILVRYDQLDQYELWKSKQGDILVGTNNQISPGPSGRYIGTYFDFVNMFIADDDTNLDDYIKNWRPVSDTDLKFNVYVARYSHSGIPVTSNSSVSNSVIRQTPLANNTYNANGTTYDIRFGSYEYISYDQDTSVKYNFIGGQWVYQNTFPYPGGYHATKTYHPVATVANSALVTANSTLPNGQSFAWSNIFTSNNTQKRLIFQSGNTVNIRNVVGFLSNTVVQLSEPLTFTNSLASFIISPTGIASWFDKTSPFGVSESFLMIANSNANSSVRFVNNTIESLSVLTGGSGYSNNDVLYITGFENITNKVQGGYKAIANLVTNSTGGITTIYLSNSGCGFVNTTAAITVVVANSTSLSNSTGNTSSGTGLTLNYTFGATLKTDQTPNIFRGCKVRNLDIGEFLPFLEVKNPPGSEYKFEIEMPYERRTSTVTFSGYEYYVNPNAGNNRILISMYATNYTSSMNYTPMLPSKSNEFFIKYADGSSNDKIGNNDSVYSLAFRLAGNVVSNSDFTCTMIKGLPSVSFSKYLVNNDETGERTDSGNAWAKEITKTFSFQRPSEDIRVYLTAYNPANCNISVYARMYKSEDTDSFDDKDWTKLELKNNPSRSSLADDQDYIEYEYGLYQYPQDRTSLSGVVSATLSSATITGSNTVFSGNLVAGSVVLLRQPLFPNNHIVAVVNSVASNTSLTLTEAITNTSLVAEGMTIDIITYPGQAFNNIQKDNVSRYFNSSITAYDGWDQAAIKVVYLSDNPAKVPRIDDIKVAGVSA